METPVTVTEPSSLWDKGKLFLKAIIIFLMALALWVPTYFIMGLVKEREERQHEAISDISSKWAGQQTVTPPLLMIPYQEANKDGKGNTVIIKRNAYFLADQVQVRCTVIPEKRYRGIYQVVVYRSDIHISGKFGPLAWQQLKVPAADLLWGEASLIFRVTDNLKGINEEVAIKWGDSSITMAPQPSGLTPYHEAFVAPVPLTEPDAAAAHTFSMDFSLNGSQQLLFAPAARENKVEMKSAWADPSFTGMKLPDSREISDSGFTARWRFLNRSVPLVWNNTVYNLDDSSFGADLVISVDGYDKTLRSVKYALLCIVLTFAAFFLIEAIYKKPLHLVQYGLAGLALVLFYTLLLSLSEYTSFNLAYGLAGIATNGLVVWYVGSIMKSAKLAAFISFVLSVVYAYIFSIIQLQDYSLLMGSIGLFIALAVIMYFSRKLQWS
ncbi:MAG: cell envelope integrity protein CreD [Chitinophagaceae bacterium]